MFRQKALQDIISNFTDQINRFIKLELGQNHKEFEKEMKRTQPPDESIQ